MATWDDVDGFASALPEATRQTSGRDGLTTWKVRSKGFVWERPLRKADYEALGDNAPEGPILGVSVPDLVAKEALIADDPDVFFATPHFDGYPAVLLQLEHIATDELEEVVVEAWLSKAPKRLAKEFLTSGMQ